MASLHRCILRHTCLRSSTGNKDILVLRVLAALYPQHASSILNPSCGSTNPQSDIRTPVPYSAQVAQAYTTSSFAAIPQTNGTCAMLQPVGLHAAPIQPSTSPRVQVHLRAAAAPYTPQSLARAPPHAPAALPLLKEAASRWSHPMFQQIAFEAFVFTHPVTNFQGALPFDKPQAAQALEKLLIVPLTRRSSSGGASYAPTQLLPGPSVAVSWNNCPVELPKFVTVKSKLAAATIHPHPIFLPPNAPFHKAGPNRLVMTGGGADIVFGVAIILVRPRQLDELEALVRSHPMSKIRKRPEFNQDDDCAATSTPVQLKDPLSFCRIRIPVKTVKCKHVQCFDLATFIQYCERNGIWYCPCCPSKPGLSINDMYVDQFFMDMIEDASAHDSSVVCVSFQPHRCNHPLTVAQLPQARRLMDNFRSRRCPRCAKISRCRCSFPALAIPAPDAARSNFPRWYTSWKRMVIRAAGWKLREDSQSSD